jgi:branched-chain amino acid transport system ATP-binding protein|tara:strand:+ start:548 stop:1255 length:708 start_codon:yes stop_codon:yes gene_type:complete
MLLEINDMRIHYGKIQAVKGISMTLEEGQIAALIGANGAGKTTVLRAVSGLQKLSAGSITFNGQPIQNKAPHDIVAMGITHIPEGRRLFKLMTVEDNLRLGAFLLTDRKEIDHGLETIYDQFPILREKRLQLSGELSGGQQQMVAMGRAMMARPSIILMDEPSLGLAPVIIDDIAKLILKLRDSGVSIVLVEQNAHLALKLANNGYVMETGRIALEGAADDLLHDPEVARVYLGA